jgi:hypothetical protein
MTIAENCDHNIASRYDREKKERLQKAIAKSKRLKLEAELNGGSGSVDDEASENTDARKAMKKKKKVPIIFGANSESDEPVKKKKVSKIFGANSESDEPVKKKKVSKSFGANSESEGPVKKKKRKASKKPAAADE